MLRGPLEVNVLWDHPWWTLGAIFLIAIVTGPVLQNRVVGRRLSRPDIGGHPLLEWQKAGTEARMKQIVEAWGTAGRRLARASLLIDGVFLLAYGALMSFAFSMAATFFRSAQGDVGEWIAVGLAWAAILPSALDFAENVYLWRMLKPFHGDALPAEMYWVSRRKWKLGLFLAPLSAVGLLYGVLGCPFRC